MPRHGVDIAHIRMLRSRGMISPRAAGRMGGSFEGTAGQAEYRGGRDNYQYGATSADGQSLRRGDGGRGDRGVVRPDHNNDDRFQRGGRVSRTGGAGKERQVGASHIDEQNRRVWPKGAQIDSANRNAKLRNGEHWLANYASRQQARSKQANEYYPNEDGTLKGDPGWRQD